MKKVKLAEILNNRETKAKIIEAMRSGQIFVYPTDTIYGIGCNAERGASVRKIAYAKGREESKTFSVIVPDKEWIWSHAEVSEANRKLIDSMLPGPYTFIVKARESAPQAAVSEGKTLGVRMPKHPFCDVIREAGVPFVSTSVNISGEQPVSGIDLIPERITGFIDWAVDAGRISGHSSRVFDLTSDEIKILRY